MKKKTNLYLLITLMLIAGLFSGCGNASQIDENNKPDLLIESEKEDTSTNSAEEESQTNTESDDEAGSENEDSETTEKDSETENSETKSEITNPDNTKTENTDKTPEEKPAWTVADMSKTMYVKSSVNVRSGPGSSYEKLGSLSEDDEVHITGKCNEYNWYQISFNGTTAYVSASYLSDKRQGIYIGDKLEPSEEPQYGVVAMTPLDAVWNSELGSGWHHEKGIRYFVWVANAEEENGGHWEKRFEGHPSNKWTLEDLIPHLDKAFDLEYETRMPKRAGAYDGEEVRNDRIAFIYLGGGLLDEYK